MNAGAFRLDLHAELVAVSGELRLIQHDLLPVRHHDPVSLVPDGVHRMKNLYIFLFHLGHFFQNTQKLILAGDIFTDQITEHFIIVGIIHLEPYPDAAVRHADAVHLAFFDEFALQGNRPVFHIPDTLVLLHDLLHPGHNIRLHFVVSRKHFHPLWHVKLDHGKRKLVEHIFKDMIDILLFQLFAVHRHSRHVIFFPDLLCGAHSLLAVRLFGI